MASKMKTTYANVSITSALINQAVKNYTFSSRYIITMMRATVLNILYHRLNIDDTNFVDKTFEKIVYKSFNKSSKSPYIRNFHTYMEGFQHAFSQQYLRHMYLMFYDKDSEEVIERYKFSFQYIDGKEQIQSQTSAELRQLTINLLSGLNDLRDFEKVTQRIEVHCELSYLEHTPRNYEPPGFRITNKGEQMKNKIKQNTPLYVPNLFTGFHKMRCEIRGYFYNTSQDDKSENAAITEEAEDFTPSPQREKTRKRTRDTKADERKTKKSKFEAKPDKNSVKQSIDDLDRIDVQTPEDNFIQEPQLFSTPTRSMITMSEQSEMPHQERAHCFCELPEEYMKTIEKIKCSLCAGIFHLPCLGYLDYSFLGMNPEEFQCDRCLAVFSNSQSYQTGSGLTRIRLILGLIYANKCPEDLANALSQDVERLEVTSFFVNNPKNPGKKQVDMSSIPDLIKIHNKKPHMKRFQNIDLDNLFKRFH